MIPAHCGVCYCVRVRTCACVRARVCVWGGGGGLYCTLAHFIAFLPSGTSFTGRIFSLPWVKMDKVFSDRAGQARCDSY